MKHWVMVVVAGALLAGCADNNHKGFWGWPKSHWKEQDFKPYVDNQQTSQSQAYPAIDWSYPEGTDTAEIMRRWRQAELVMQVYSRSPGLGRSMVSRTSPHQTLAVYVGPGFYRLAPSAQQGLAQAIDRLYKVESSRQGTYLLYDVHTREPIGTYANKRLTLY